MTEHEARTGDKTMHDDEAERLERGRKAWADVPDAAEWQREIRGSTEAAERPALVGGEDVRLVLAEMREEARELEGAADDAASLLMSWHDRINAALSLPAAQDGVMVPDGSMSVDEAVAAVADLFPGADKQALRVLARALTKKPTPSAIRGDKGAEAVDAECPFCPVEIRNLHAVAHNCVVGYPYRLDIDELRRAVEMAKPFADRHFSDRAHSHPEHGKPRKPLERVVEAICDVFPAPTQAAAKDTP